MLKPISPRDERMWDHGYARAMERVRDVLIASDFDTIDRNDLAKKLGIKLPADLGERQ